jgi:hypothetical protein
VQFCDSRPCGGLQGAPHNSHIQTSKSVRVKSSCIFSKAGPLLFTALQSASFGVFSQSETHTKRWARWQRTHAVALCVIDAGKDVERDHVQLSISRGQTLCARVWMDANVAHVSSFVALTRTHRTILAAFDGMRRLFVLGRRFERRTRNLSVVGSPSGARGGLHSSVETK